MSIQDLIDICNIQYDKENKNSIWTDSLYYKLNLLKANNSGLIGEFLIKKLCKKCNVSIIDFCKNKILKDGTYDFIINNKKVEIKTARIGNNNSFQHESLRNNGSDYYIFIDILPKYYYLTIIKKFNFFEKHEILNIKPHLRKGTSNVFKMDLKEKHILNGIKNKISFKITENLNIIDIEKFLLNTII